MGKEPMRQGPEKEVSEETLKATGLFSDQEINAMLEAMSSYDRNRKRAAQRAADRNAARAAGKTGVVPGVGYVSPRKEKETYVDSAGTTRHKSGAKMP
jgi:cell division protein FtsI/penicillin-binding protein 2